MKQCDNAVRARKGTLFIRCKPTWNQLNKSKMLINDAGLYLQNFTSPTSCYISYYMHQTRYSDNDITVICFN